MRRSASRSAARPAARRPRSWWASWWRPAAGRRGSRRWFSTAAATSTTAASRRWPKGPATKVFSSKRFAVLVISEGDELGQGLRARERIFRAGRAHQPRHQGGEGGQELLLLRAGGDRGRQGPRGLRRRQGDRGAGRHPQGDQ